MKRYHYSYDGLRLLWIDEAEPVCGHDYCDTCGDCLACYGAEPCYHSEDGEHFWVVYEPEGTQPRKPEQ